MSKSSEPSTKSSSWERRLTIGLIVVGLILVLFFGLRAVRSYIRIQQTGLQPGVTDVEAIRGWMTIPYIAAFYEVPEEYIFEEIGIPREGNEKRSLGRLDREYAEERGALVEAVKAAIRQYQADQPAPPGSDQ